MTRLLKKVLWAMFVSAMVATAAFAARRMSASLWKRTMHEKPPSTT